MGIEPVSHRICNDLLLGNRNWDVAVALPTNDLAPSRSIRRPLPPRQFCKCMRSNEIHPLGRGMQTHNRHFNRHQCPGNTERLPEIRAHRKEPHLYAYI